MFNGPFGMCHGNVRVSLAAVDPICKSLTFCGFSGNFSPLISKKTKSKDPFPNSSQATGAELGFGGPLPSEWLSGRCLKADGRSSGAGWNC